MNPALLIPLMLANFKRLVALSPGGGVIGRKLPLVGIAGNVCQRVKRGYLEELRREVITWNIYRPGKCILCDETPIDVKDGTGMQTKNPPGSPTESGIKRETHKQRYCLGKEKPDAEWQCARSVSEQREPGFA